MIWGILKTSDKPNLLVKISGEMITDGEDPRWICTIVGLDEKPISEKMNIRGMVGFPLYGEKGFPWKSSVTVLKFQNENESESLGLELADKFIQQVS